MRLEHFAGLLLLAFCAQANDIGEPLAAFSLMLPGEVSDAWHPQQLKDLPPTEFQIVDHGGQTVLQAAADRSASALAHLAPVNSAATPVLNWRWKIGAHPPSDIRTKAGDDYAARVYVSFARDPAELSWLTRMKMRFAKLFYGVELPTASICYVWDPNSPEGFAIPNAWSDTIYMVVAEGGPKVNSWVSESHNFVEDYRRLFKAEPPPVTSIIVAADTDNTGTTSIAWLDDLSLSN